MNGSRAARRKGSRTETRQQAYERKRIEMRNAHDAKRAQKLQARSITAGELWRHFEGGVCRIIAADARMENSGEPCVVYAAVHDNSVWVRLRIAFLNEVAPGVVRFCRLSKQQAKELLP